MSYFTYKLPPAVHHTCIDLNPLDVSLHNENTDGDIGSAGSLHRLLRGLAVQRSQRRDEFITAELTNHLFQSGSFPFGLDLAAINIQRGRDHGIPAYTQWREPCGLSPIRDWIDLEKVVGFESANRIQQGYRSVDDVDLFVAGLAERPVIGGLVGPTFACIIAQQFSNLRKGDRFWYETDGFESSFTPAQLQSIRQVSLAQIICRTLGAGTLQLNVFLPHDLLGNARQPCGIGALAPIDLLPWQERDPSLSKVDERDPFLNPFLTKQESLDLVASSEELRPHKIPSTALRPPFISTSENLRPNRHPGAPHIIEPSIIISPADLRPNKTPRPSFSHFRPADESDAVRPNREPTNGNIILLSEITPLIDRRPNREPTTIHQPTVSPTLEPLINIQRPPNVETSAVSTIGVLHVVIDKVDFNDENSPSTVNNKIEFTTKQAASVHISKRPVTPIRKSQVDNRKKTDVDDSINAQKTVIFNSTQDLLTNNAEMNVNKKLDLTNLTMNKRQKRDIMTKDSEQKTTNSDKTKLKQVVILNTDRKPSFDVEITNKPSISQDFRPLLNKHNPNNIIVLGDNIPTSTTQPDLGHFTNKQYIYDRPSPTSGKYIPINRNEFATSNGQYALSYDVTVTTTESFSYYRPLDQPTDYDLNLPYTFQKPDFSMTTSTHPFASTPFSYDPTKQKLTSNLQDGKLTKPFHKRLGPNTNRDIRLQPKPTKLDFGEDINLTPFNNGGLTPVNHNQNTNTYYLNQNDDDDDLHVPTTKKQNDRLQADIDTFKPGQVYFLADPPIRPTPVPTTSVLQNLYPSVVLQKFVSSISKYFGYGKPQQTSLTRPLKAAEEANLRELTRVIQSLDNNQTDGKEIDKNLQFDKNYDGLSIILDKTAQDSNNDSTTLKRLPDYLEHFSNGTIQFDLDGYLRPEYMNLDQLMANQTNNNDTTTGNDHNFDYKKRPIDTNEKDPCELPVQPPQPIAPLNIKDIPFNYKTTEDRKILPVYIQSRSRSPESVSFVPIQLLTRPER